MNYSEYAIPSDSGATCSEPSESSGPTRICEPNSDAEPTPETRNSAPARTQTTSAPARTQATSAPARVTARPRDARSRSADAARFDVAPPEPAWRALLTQQLRALTGAEVGEPGGGYTHLTGIAALLEQVDALFARGATQAYVEEHTEPQAIPRAGVAGSSAGSGTGSNEEGGVDEQAIRAANLSQWFSALYAHLGRLLQRKVLPDLGNVGLRVCPAGALNPVRVQAARQVFLRNLYPVLTPLAIDSGHPFPYIATGAQNLLFELQSPEQVGRRSPKVLFARVEIPATRPALVALEAEQAESAPVALPRESYCDPPCDLLCDLLWSADLVRYFAQELFPGMVLRNSYLFRVMRGGPAQSACLLEATDGRDGRPWRESGHAHVAQPMHAAPVVRLEVESSMPDAVTHWLAEHLRAPRHGLVRVDHAQELLGLPGLLQKLHAFPQVAAMVPASHAEAAHTAWAGDFAPRAAVTDARLPAYR